MSAARETITGLETKTPLFREFCRVHDLNNGDTYSPLDYIFWADGLTIRQELETIRRYDPAFKLAGCNL